MTPAAAPARAHDRLGRALRNGRIAFFDDSGAGDGDGDPGGWHWSGSHFGVAGIDGPAGRASLLQAVFEADRPAACDVLSLQSNARSRSGEVRLRAPNGGTIYLQCDADCEVDASGRPVAVAGIIRDVTTDRRFEAELTEIVRMNHMLLATIDACPISITVADATQHDLPMIYANRMFFQISGYEAADVIGQNFRFLQGPGSEPDTVADIRRTIETGAQAEIQVVNHRKDGSSFLNRLTLAPIRDDDGSLIAYVGMQADVTVNAEQRIAEDHRQKMEALGRMMGGVAHEINNMLQPVMLLGQEIIDQDLVVGDGRQHLEILLECALKARSIIGDLLAFSRPTARCVTVHDPVQLLNESLRLVRQAVPPSVTLTVRIGGQPPLIAIDRTMFTQILLNLVSNAAAAMQGRGEVTITLDAHRPRAADAVAQGAGQAAGQPFNDGIADAARLRIKDNGCGMDKVTLDRAFEPFFTTKPVGEGTGLGLPLVYGLVRELGGSAALDSAPGHGTTATILIPGQAAPGLDAAEP